MSANPVVWFEVYVQDMARARQFYEAVFQVELRPLTPPLAELQILAFPSDLQAYGTPGALVKASGVPSGGNSTLVYFRCEDCAVEAGRAAGAGGRIERAKMAIGEFGFISLIRDTEGNLVGLHSMR